MTEKIEHTKWLKADIEHAKRLALLKEDLMDISIQVARNQRDWDAQGRPWRDKDRITLIRPRRQESGK